jgi:hypothetical protein
LYGVASGKTQGPGKSPVPTVDAMGTGLSGRSLGEGEQVTFSEVSMPGRNRTSPIKRAAVTHRAALTATRAAFASWLASNDGVREVVPSSLQLLSECANDKTGDKTLDVLSEIFETHDAEEFPAALTARLVALAESAHAIGQSEARFTVKETRKYLRRDEQ